MSTRAAVSLAATIVSLLFTLQVARQYVERHRTHQLVWTVALALYTTGVGTQFLAELFGWQPGLYRVWYLSGAILTAAYFGQGTMYLIAGRRVAHRLMAALLVASALAALLVMLSDVDMPRALASGEITGRGMPPDVRALAPFFNIYGTAALVGGALWSTWRFVRSGGGGWRAVGTGLISIGAMVVAMGGTLERFGVPQALYGSELLGVAIIYAGFSLATLPSRAHRPRGATS